MARTIDQLVRDLAPADGVPGALVQSLDPLLGPLVAGRLGMRYVDGSLTPRNTAEWSTLIGAVGARARAAAGPPPADLVCFAAKLPVGEQHRAGELYALAPVLSQIEPHLGTEAELQIAAQLAGAAAHVVIAHRDDPAYGDRVEEHVADFVEHLRAPTAQPIGAKPESSISDEILGSSSSSYDEPAFMPSRMRRVESFSSSSSDDPLLPVGAAVVATAPVAVTPVAATPVTAAPVAVTALPTAAPAVVAPAVAAPAVAALPTAAPVVASPPVAAPAVATPATVASSPVAAPVRAAPAVLRAVREHHHADVLSEFRRACLLPAGPSRSIAAALLAGQYIPGARGTAAYAEVERRLVGDNPAVGAALERYVAERPALSSSCWSQIYGELNPRLALERPSAFVRAADAVLATPVPLSTGAQIKAAIAATQPNGTRLLHALLGPGAHAELERRRDLRASIADGALGAPTELYAQLVLPELAAER